MVERALMRGELMKAVIWRVATGTVLAVVAAAATAADPIDVVIPAPVDGVVTEYTLFDFAAVSIWRTNAQKQDVQPALVEGQVITKIGGGGDYIVRLPGLPPAERYIRDNVTVRVAADPTLPDIHQIIQKVSGGYTPAGTGNRAAPTPDEVVAGEVSDLSIEATVFDPVGGRYRLVDVFGTIAQTLGPRAQVNIPDLFADTNLDGELGPGDRLYSLVDLRWYLSALPTFTLGDTFTIVDGRVEELPGMLFSSMPFLFDEVRGFYSDGLLGQSSMSRGAGGVVAAVLAQHGLTPQVPEPSAVILALTGLGVLARRHRWSSGDSMER